MSVNLTDVFQNLVLHISKSHGATDGDLKSLRSSQILRSLGAKSTFSKAAEGVAQNIATLRQILRENQSVFYQPGAATERDVTEIEAQIREYVGHCKQNIEKLQDLCTELSDAKSMEMAHRQGCVLILAERLKAAIMSFESMQRTRMSRMEHIESSKRRRTPLVSKSSSKTSKQDPLSHLRRMAEGFSQHSEVTSPEGHVQLDAQLQSENFALQQDLVQLSDRVQHAEKSVREIASLNQAFSAAIFQQAEQIETLYNEAVQASENIQLGNVQLEKTVRVNKSSRKCLLILLFVFSLALLFVDWFYS